MILGGIDAGRVTDWEDELGVDCLEAGAFEAGAFAGRSLVPWVTRGAKVGATGDMGIKAEEEADDVSLNLECNPGGVEKEPAEAGGDIDESERSVTGFGFRFFFVVFAGTLAGFVSFSVLLVDRTEGAAERESATGAWMISPSRRRTWCVAFLEGFGNLVREASLAAEADTAEAGREMRLLGRASCG